ANATVVSVVSRRSRSKSSRTGGEYVAAAKGGVLRQNLLGRSPQAHIQVAGRATRVRSPTPARLFRLRFWLYGPLRSAPPGALSGRAQGSSRLFLRRTLLIDGVRYFV